jgi:hypothetical protein
MFQCQFSFCIK